MTIHDRVVGWFRPIVYLGNNTLTMIGAVLTTSAGITLVGFWALEIIHGGPTQPYAGIFLFLILPAVFLLGLLLMPVGALWRRHKLRRAGVLPAIFPPIDLGQPILRHAVILVGVATVANVAIMGTATYKGVEHMDSVGFCGLTCHTVMAPEYSAYQGSPHARVACVQCHIGPGANWFVRSKLSGVRQVFAVAFDTYSRPIPSPVEALRPARETCEQCHWPRRFTGDKLVVKRTFSDDEANTELYTVLMLRVGGEGRHGGAGIHGRHLNATERIRYEGLDGRTVIPKVVYRDDDGKLVEFDSDQKPTPAQQATAEERTMDCMDCHNRPTHSFRLPGEGVDLALADGSISRDLPFVKKKAVELLKVDYPDRATASREIVSGLEAYYETSYPDIFKNRHDAVTAAATRVRDIYLRNVFPQMNVTWGTYPNHIGHTDSPGCFRCHDDEHKSAQGRVITQDCDACHAILAMEEEHPAILKELGID